LYRYYYHSPLDTGGSCDLIALSGDCSGHDRITAQPTDQALRLIGNWG